MNKNDFYVINKPNLKLFPREFDPENLLIASNIRDNIKLI